MSLPVVSWHQIERRARAIASVSPFSRWPAPAVTRLARASRVAAYPPGAMVVERSGAVHSIVLIVSGVVEAAVVDRGGRRFTFKVAGGGRLYGMLPLLDAREMPSDVVSVEPVVAISVPHVAILTELERLPGLWETVAREVSARARAYTDQLKSLVFDSLDSRFAAVLVGLAEAVGQRDPARSGAITFRLSQERLGGVLGVSRQTAAAIAGRTIDAGVLRWRYGRVAVVDLPRLREMARGTAISIPSGGQARSAAAGAASAAATRAR